MTDFLRACAALAGLPAFGVARAESSDHSEAFEAWLDAGCAGGMQYLRRHALLRRDPRSLLAGAGSIVVAALPYPVNPAPDAGGFSMLGRCRDYHVVLRNRLAALAHALAERDPGLRWRVCVDSAPLAEREWAVRAGLGWIGRQGQLIHPDFGATVVLGALLVNRAFPAAAAPQANQCGDCRRCLDACPGNALQPDGRLDARRCASYLTIEHRALALTAEETRLVGRAWFGCDRCTAICPWNRAPAAVLLPDFAPRPMPTAAEILAMDTAAFDAVFRDTVVHRTGLASLQRNVRASLQRNVRASQPPTRIS